MKKKTASWYEKFGLRTNPFTTDPFAVDYTFVNYSDVIEELLYHIKAGNMYVLIGSEGTGKTMMLRQVIKVFAGQGRVLYIDGNKYQKEFDIEKELQSKGRNFLNRLRQAKVNNLIVLLDNADALTNINMQKLKYYYDQNYIQSVIFTASKQEDLTLSKSIRDRIVTNTRTIPPLINYDALRIVRNRFADHFFLPDDIILKLFKQSNGNIKLLLENSEKVCAYVISKGKGEVLSKYIRMALHKPKSKSKAQSRSRSTKKVAVGASE